MTVVEAVRLLRRDPAHASRMHDAYITGDLRSDAQRFRASVEFAETLRLLGGDLAGRIVLDVGAGTGIASYAFASVGARVYALEPDPGGDLGRGAIAVVTADLDVEILAGVGETIPLGDAAADVVYARQVLHHAEDLPRLIRECARVLQPGGVLLACREHVVDDDEQLQEFLASHPVHQLAGGEHARPLRGYVTSITEAGLRLERTLGPLDSVINAFPAFRSEDELRRYPRALLTAKLGRLGALLGRVPAVQTLVRRRIGRLAPPGRLYSFLATKPVARTPR
ncbi:MAG: class I SAM-dependent methyltransferase [Actinobacteria bacterium]|nr:class I SAM-dependent methyltransferase [Actinomycetota bacterium]